MPRERKMAALSGYDPDNIVCIQPNFGSVIHVGDAPLQLTKDLTRGTLVVKLIRNRIDESFLEECVRALSGRERKRSRAAKHLTAMLDQFDYQFTREERAYVASNICRFMGSSSFLEVSENNNGSVYMLLHSGAEALSDIIANTGRSFYLDAESQMRDLVKAQRFAEINRIAILKRLFGIYYQTTRIEECVMERKNFNYHTIDADRGEVRFATQKTAKSDKSIELLLMNIKDGALFYHSKEMYAPSGCGRKIYLNQAQLRNPLYLEAAKAALRGIRHSQIDLYIQHQPLLYQSVEDFMELPEKRVTLKPKCNFRPDS